MLSDALTTNEIKNASGTEVEFLRVKSGDFNTEFMQSAESPALKHRLKISHQEVGVGFNRRRRSVLRIDKDVVSDVDATKTVTNTAYVVTDSPVGAITTMAEPKNVLAELMSFLASLGANTTILYDCTGNGAASLVNGTL